MRFQFDNLLPVCCFDSSVNTQTLHFNEELKEGKAAHLYSPSREGLYLSVCPEGPLDPQIVYSSVLSLTLLFIVLPFWESLSRSGGSPLCCGPSWRSEDTGSGLQADLPCGMKHSRRGSLVLWIGLDCDKGAAAVLRMGEGGFHPWMWVVRHPGDTQLSSQTQMYHIEHHIESAWAPYVYRHVLISLFLSQNITFVKLQGVIIIRNNADFHTKKENLLIKKDK